MAASQFDAQHAVRMDAEQLNDYMQELFNWSKDMKRNERAKPPPPPQAAPAASKQQASGPTADQLQQQQAVPPPPPQQQQEEGGSVARHPAAHTYEHYSRKWDRFDVDAALAEDDAEGGTSTQQASTQPAQQPSSSSAAPSSSGRSAPVAIPQARATVPVGPSKASAPAVAPTSVGAAPTSAEGWKDAGNAAFKRGQHREAADCYTRSLELQPTCLAFANRAMARLKLGQAAEAEADCSQALDLDPLYTKAYLRRATARRQLGQLLGAVEDCESALRLEPNNKQAAGDRAACVAALLKEEGLEPLTRSQWLPLVLSSSTGTSGGSGGSGGCTLGGTDQPAEELAAGAGHKAAAAAEAPAGDALISVAAVKRLKPETAAVAAQTDVATLEPAATAEAVPASQQGAAEWPTAATSAAGGGCGGSAAEAATPDVAKPAAAAPAAEAVARQQPPASAPVVPAAAAAAAVAPAAFKPPRTGLEFEKAWKGLKGDRQLQAAYLLALQPSSLPTLLRQALSPGLLAAAAAALLRPGMQQAPAAAVGLLESLAQVPRFDLNLLSVPPRQRAELAADWDAAAAGVEAQAGGEGPALAGRLMAVRQRYKL